jgi:hypothetical protein
MAGEFVIKGGEFVTIKWDEFVIKRGEFVTIFHFVRCTRSERRIDSATLSSPFWLDVSQTRCYQRSVSGSSGPCARKSLLKKIAS